MAWCFTKPLPAPTLTPTAEQATSHYLNQWWHSLLTHICVTRPQEVNTLFMLDQGLTVTDMNPSGTEAEIFWISEPILLLWMSWFLVLPGHQQPWYMSLQWHHNGHDGISNHQPHDCLLNRLFRRRSKKTSKLCVTGLCVGNSPVTGEFPAQMASNAENVPI